LGPYLALRETILDGRILRSGDPAGLRQEMWALLALYQIIHTRWSPQWNRFPAPILTGPASPSR
jgi:hypothetical protein